ncbi:alpha/beta hydrolase [Sagittula sp. NFXS13]|uniref:alpha/beta fold hydrolase n=1 Tax=Sagittula sp. NFXS13 TaxID=2819095 RepID=UPI0032DF988C
MEWDLEVRDPTRATYGVIPIYGTNLKWRAVGDGQPLVLLHGVPGDCETLAPVADLLAETARATTLSMRYSGHGPYGARPFGTQQQYQDLIEIAETIGGPIDIAAWSYSAHASRLPGNHLLPETVPKTLSTDIRAHLARVS